MELKRFSDILNKFPTDGRLETHFSRYWKFILSRPDRVKTVGVEDHHVLPKELAKKLGIPKEEWNSPRNRINLTVREHFIAHMILWKAYPESSFGTPVYIKAINEENKGSRGKLTSKQYAVLKEEQARKTSVQRSGMKFSDETKSKLKKVLGNNTRGKITVTNGKEDRRIAPVELSYFESLGYRRGRTNYDRNSIDRLGASRRGKPLTDKNKEGLSLSMKGRKPSDTTVDSAKVANTGNTYVKGTKVVHKGTLEKMIPKEDIEKWLSDGWQLGRLCMVGTIFITNGTHNKRIHPDDFYKWEYKGWRRGQVRRRYA